MEFCIHQSCTRHDRCHRYQLYLENAGANEFLEIINPQAISPTDGSACPHFYPHVKQRFAKGLSSFYDELPSRIASAIKADLLAYYGRTAYYRIARGDMVITPEEQEDIRQMFRRHGSDLEPEYDSFELHYTKPPCKRYGRKSLYQP